MPDWTQVVREHLAPCDLVSPDHEGVVHEIAAQLEETYDAGVASGLNEACAAELALQAIGDWRALARRIARAKSTEGLMNNRTRSLWLPALITLSGASFSLMLIQFAGMEPRLIWIDLRQVFPASSPLYGKIAMTLYWPWLTSLPFFGALGAYLSRRSEGNTPARLAAGLSPALIMLIVMCGILPFGLALDDLSLFQLVVFGLAGLFNWVALPGLALLSGARPFVWQRPVEA